MTVNFELVGFVGEVVIRFTLTAQLPLDLVSAAFYLLYFTVLSEFAILVYCKKKKKLQHQLFKNISYLLDSLHINLSALSILLFLKFCS